MSENRIQQKLDRAERQVKHALYKVGLVNSFAESQAAQGDAIRHAWNWYRGNLYPASYRVIFARIQPDPIAELAAIYFSAIYSLARESVGTARAKPKLTG